MKHFLYTLAVFSFVFLIRCDLPQPSTLTSRQLSDSLINSARIEFKSGNFKKAKEIAQGVYNGHPDSSALKLIASVDSAIAAQQAESKKRAEVILRGLRKKVDDIDETTFYFDPSTPQFSNRNSFHVYLGESKGQYWLRFKIQYYGDDWLFIDNYKIKADSSVFDFVPKEVSRDHDGGKVWESCDERVDSGTYAILKTVAESKKSKVRMIGSQYYKENEITGAQKVAIKKMLGLYELLTGLE